MTRIPVEVVSMMAKGQYGSSGALRPTRLFETKSLGDLTLISEKSLETGGGATSNAAASRYVVSLYDGAVNPHVTTPGGLVSDGARPLRSVGAWDGGQVVLDQRGVGQDGWHRGGRGGVAQAGERLKGLPRQGDQQRAGAPKTSQMSSSGGAQVGHRLRDDEAGDLFSLHKAVHCT